jgi:hypothetical protein
VRGHFLRVFERAAVGEIGGDAGRVEYGEEPNGGF